MPRGRRAGKVDLKLTDELKVVRFVKGKPGLFYKVSHHELTWEYVEFLAKDFYFFCTSTRYPDPVRGVNAEKLKKIVDKICPHMPEEKRGFWEGLEESNEPDLTENLV